MNMEEPGLLQQLGVDWKLFLSQAVNFFILLAILQTFVYKPLLAAIKKRNDKIREGLEKAEAADMRLKEIDVIAKEKLKKADGQSVVLIKNAEQRAKELEGSLQKKAESRQKELLEKIQAGYGRQQEEMQEKIRKEAVFLVKMVISKAVELNPERIDEALIKKAVQNISHEK